MSAWSRSDAFFPIFARVWHWIFGPLCPGSITISLIIIKDLAQAFILLIGPPVAAGSISLAAMLDTLPAGVPWPHTILGLLLTASALLASYAMHNRKLSHWMVCLCLLPQQYWLAAVMVEALVAINVGHYPDGYPPDGAGWFIAGDQPMLVLAAWFYTAALIVRSNARYFGDDL